MFSSIYIGLQIEQKTEKCSLGFFLQKLSPAILYEKEHSCTLGSNL